MMDREKAIEILQRLADVKAEELSIFDDEGGDVCGQILEEQDAILAGIKALKAERPHGECRTCKHFVIGGLDGKTHVCEHPSIEEDDYYNYACLAMNEKDFCSCYEMKEGETE